MHDTFGQTNGDMSLNKIKKYIAEEAWTKSRTEGKQDCLCFLQILMSLLRTLCKVVGRQ